ncbi:MAG: sugar O-acetyltransferase [Vibrio sp.]
MTEKEKMLAGLHYDPTDTQIRSMIQRARQLTEEFNQTSALEREKRHQIIAKLFGSIGKNTLIESPFQCDFGENIHVGENFFANFGCVILDVAPVHIGQNCFIGPQVGIYTATHPLDPMERISGLEYAKPVTLGDNCWIGGHAVINPGVTLGDNVVVASGAVVTKSFDSNLVIGGNPARVIKVIK